MLLWRHGKDTNNDTIRGAGSGGHSHDQGPLWHHIRQRCHPLCIAQGTTRNQAAVPATPLQIRTRHSSPCIECRGLLARKVTSATGLRPTAADPSAPTNKKLMGGTSVAAILLRLVQGFSVTGTAQIRKASWVFQTFDESGMS